MDPVTHCGAPATSLGASRTAWACATCREVLVVDGAAARTISGLLGVRAWCDATETDAAYRVPACSARATTLEIVRRGRRAVHDVRSFVVVGCAVGMAWSLPLGFAFAIASVYPGVVPLWQPTPPAFVPVAHVPPKTSAWRSTRSCGRAVRPKTRPDDGRV